MHYLAVAITLQNKREQSTDVSWQLGGDAEAEVVVEFTDEAFIVEYPHTQHSPEAAACNGGRCVHGKYSVREGGGGGKGGRGRRREGEEDRGEDR